MSGSILSVALRERLVSLLNAMPAAQAGDETSVHQARVASRRLRGVLPVLGARADADALERAHRQVRRITRALGPVRELDVTLALLSEYEQRGAAAHKAIARVRQALMHERSTRRHAMLSDLTPSRLDKLRRRLVNVAAPKAPGHPRAGEVSEAARQAAARARDLRTAMDHAGGMYLPDRLHRVRVAAKKLRYALEIQRELTRSRSLARLNKVKALQDGLGRMHDLEVLIEHTRNVQAAVAASDRKGTADLEVLVHALERECRADHAAYMRERPAILTLCADVMGTTHDSHPTAVA